jgi:hypothetical protein
MTTSDFPLSREPPPPKWLKTRATAGSSPLVVSARQTSALDSIFTPDGWIDPIYNPMFHLRQTTGKIGMVQKISGRIK